MPPPDVLAVSGFTLTAGVHAAGSTIPRHAHEGATLCLAVKGAFREYSPGRATTCYPSTLKVTPAGEPHWNRFDLGDTRGLLVEVDPARVAALGAAGAVLDRRLLDGGGLASAVARRVYDEFSTRDAATPLAVEGLLLELLAVLARRPPSRAAARARWLHEARALLESSFASPVTLGAVAQAVGVHPVTLARAFRGSYGCTVGTYVRRLRIAHAERLLREGSRPLSEIALVCGFADQSHFTNQFRRNTGVTPARYRAMARGAGDE